MIDPDGLAFLLEWALIGAGALLLAWVAEIYQGREMRKRQRKRVALERYLGLVYPKDRHELHQEHDRH